MPGAPRSWCSPSPANAPRIRSFQRGADGAGQRRQEQRALAPRRRQRGLREHLALRHGPGVLAHQLVLPPETKPGFSISSMPATAWACVSTRRSLVEDQLVLEGTATGSAVPVTSTIDAGRDRAGAERRPVLVTRADHDAGSGWTGRAPRRPACVSGPITSAAGRIGGSLAGSSSACSTRSSVPGARAQVVEQRRGRVGRVLHYLAASASRPGEPPTGASQRAAR